MLWFHLLLLIVKPPSEFRLSNHMKKKEMENMTWAKAYSPSGRNNILESLKTTELCVILLQLLMHSQRAGYFVLCEKLYMEASCLMCKPFSKMKGN